MSIGSSNLRETQDLILTFDVGTSSVKATLFDREVRILANACEAYPLLLPHSGWAEQRPEDWWRAICRVTGKILARAAVPASCVVAINFAAQTCGTIPVDENGTPLHNCLIWLDTRSRPIAERIVGGFPRIRGYGLPKLPRWLWLTNGIPNLSGKDPTSKILWFRETMPDIWRNTFKVLDVKDYLLHRCGGRYVTTPDCAHLTWLMDSRKDRKCWSPTLLASLKLDEERLPEIVPTTNIIGNLTPVAARELGLAMDTAIVAGASDVAASALGAGAILANHLHLYIGSSAWLGAHRPTRKVDVTSGIGTICSAFPDRYLLVAAQESAGSCVEWAARALGFFRDNRISLDDFNAAAGSAPAGTDELFFFPWLYGERAPMDDASLRGGFCNLSLAHGREEMSRAVLEGVALNIRWAMEHMERLCEEPGNPVRLVGGGANSALWCQILADVLQRPLHRIQSPHLAGCRGMATSTAVALGWRESLEQAATEVRVGNVYEPDTHHKALYDEKFSYFLHYLKNNRRWFRQLNRKDRATFT
uniref:Xylulokinase n=1 Tax=Candidatus Kentrum sp. FW TaxID=2126338 RepID=A0A450S6Q0_9GAMM|nr:MAG: xylulokinase [Candidatus Kentron sp. FW]